MKTQPRVFTAASLYVADYRMANMLAVDPKLIGAARHGLKF